MSKDNVTKFPGVEKIDHLKSLEDGVDGLVKAFPLIAQAKKAAFDSYVNAGFTEEQAIQLVKGDL